MVTSNYYIYLIIDIVKAGHEPQTLGEHGEGLS